MVRETVIKFHDTYKAQWDIENKTIGFEVTDGRIGFLIQRITTAINTVSDYLEGKATSIPELEEDVLPYNAYPDDEPHCFKTWEEIVSANKVI